MIQQWSCSDSPIVRKSTCDPPDLTCCCCCLLLWQLLQLQPDPVVWLNFVPTYVCINWLAPHQTAVPLCCCHLVLFYVIWCFQLQSLPVCVKLSSHCLTLNPPELFFMSAALWQRCVEVAAGQSLTTDSESMYRTNFKAAVGILHLWSINDCFVSTWPLDISQLFKWACQWCCNRLPQGGSSSMKKIQRKEWKGFPSGNIKCGINA